MSALLWWGERRNPGKTLFELLEKRLSRVGRIAFFAAMGVYLLAVIIITTAYLAEFVSIGFIQETPFWVIVAFFSVSVMYSLLKGLGALLIGVTLFAGTLFVFQNTVVFDMVVNNFAYGTAAVFVVFLLAYLVLVVH